MEGDPPPCAATEEVLCQARPDLPQAPASGAAALGLRQLEDLTLSRSSSRRLGLGLFLRFDFDKIAARDQNQEKQKTRDGSRGAERKKPEPADGGRDISGDRGELGAAEGGQRREQGELRR